MRRLLAAGLGSLAVLAAGCGADDGHVVALPAGQFVRAAGDLEPRTQLFGDLVRARIDVVVDRTKLDPERISFKGSFAPYEQVGETDVSRTDAGDLTRLRYLLTLRCIDYACIGERGPVQPNFGGFDPKRGSGTRTFRFAAGSLLYADPGQAEPRVLRSVRWPLLEAVSRINSQDPAQTFGFPFRWSQVPLPALTTRVSPGLLAALLFAAAALLFALPVTLAVRRLRRRAPEPEQPEPEPTPLERALALVEWSRARGGEERRAALEALAAELDVVDADGLADLARAAAWRPPFPSADDAARIAETVREAHGLAG